MLPIVLHHGIFGCDRMRIGPLVFSYFGGGIEHEIASRGHPLIVARVSKTASIAHRAAELKQTLLERLAGSDDRVVILAHSMGGLDARYMIDKLDMSCRVAAMITLSTPHRGSSYADWVLKNIDKSRQAQNFLKFVKLDLAGLRDLTTEAVARFNDIVLDHPEVRYFSVSAARPWHRVPAFLVHSHRIVSREEGENDGVVSVKSAAWGTHLETWPADHMHMINRRYVIEIRSPTGNVRNRYAGLLDQLAARGIVAPRSASALPTMG